MTRVERPLPGVNDENKRYYAPENGVLEVQRCLDCGFWNFYPRTHCRKCLSTNLQWQSASPAGTVYSFAIVHRPQHEFFFDSAPHIMVVVDMDDGFQMIASLEQEDDEAIQIGDRVTVCRQPMTGTDSLSIPIFRRIGFSSEEATG